MMRACYDAWKNRLGQELDLLRQLHKLRNFSGPGEANPHLIPKLMNFLESQTGCIQEVSLTPDLILCCTKSQVQKLLAIFGRCKHLKSMTWCDSDLEHISKMSDNLMLCPTVQSIQMYLYRYEDFDKLPLSRLFPALESINLDCSYGPGIRLVKCENLLKVTSFKLSESEMNGFEMMLLMPNLKKMSLDTLLWQPSNQISMQQLTDLEVNYRNLSLGFNMFKLFFNTCPNLVTLLLTLNSLKSFHEDKFCDFLQTTSGARNQLEKLQLVLLKQPLSMTGATVCALLRYSGLKPPENLWELCQVYVFR